MSFQRHEDQVLKKNIQALPTAWLGIAVSLLITVFACHDTW